MYFGVLSWDKESMGINTGKDPKKWLEIAIRMAPRSVEKVVAHAKWSWNARIAKVGCAYFSCVQEKRIKRLKEVGNQE